MAECFLCADCGSVCESHPERPWKGEYACGCGSAGTPCPSCNKPADGEVPGSSFTPDEHAAPPRSPLPNAATAGDGRGHTLVCPLLAMGTLIAGGYVALVWFANPSTPDKDAVSRPQNVATRSNDKVPAPAERCMPIGLTARGDLTFPLQCGELRDRLTYPAREVRPELAAAVRPKQSARVDHAPQTLGSTHNQNVENSPPKGSGERSGVDPAPRVIVKPAPDGSRAIGENRKGQQDAWQSSRTLRDRRQRFTELINHPLALNCINCLLFGY
jgi:hypothetical protein